MTEWHAELSKAFDGNRQLSSERQSLWGSTITDLFGAAPGGVLDAGCGSGRFLPMLHGVGSFTVGLDADAFLLRRCSSQVACLVKADVHQMPFRGEAFGGVWGSMILEQSTCPHRIVAEMARVSKPFGVVVCRFASPEDLPRTTWWSLFPSLLNRYRSTAVSSEELQRWATDSGLEPVSISRVEERVTSSTGLEQHLLCIRNRAYSPLATASDSEVDVAVREAATLKEFRVSCSVATFRKNG